MAGQEDPNQPRQPHDLEGLLKFCMQATQSEDAPTRDSQNENQMDPERLQWLQEAMSGMTVDVVSQLVEGIKILSQPYVFDPNATDDEITEAEEAFEAISDWVGNIDMANNFQKIGGFVVLKRCIKSSPHSLIRWNAADTVAELSQNNPYCQEHFVKDGFIQDLIIMLQNEVVNDNENIRNEKCSLKSLYAISCIVRDYGPGLETFLALNGPEILLQCAIQPHTTTQRLRTKACFFVSAISCESQEAAKAFSDMGLARQLLVLLQQAEHQQVDEHVVKALLTLLRNDKSAQRECRESRELNLEGLLDARKKDLKDKEEFQEELDYYIEIENLCYGHDKSSISDTEVNR